MKDEIIGLVRAGLFEDNLRKLIPLCKASHAQFPSVYGSLILVFESLAAEYDSQAISVERYNSLLSKIQAPIIALLENDGDPTVVIKNLDELFVAFADVKGY